MPVSESGNLFVRVWKPVHNKATAGAGGHFLWQLTANQRYQKIFGACSTRSTLWQAQRNLNVFLTTLCWGFLTCRHLGPGLRRLRGCFDLDQGDKRVDFYPLFPHLVRFLEKVESVLHGDGPRRGNILLGLVYIGLLLFRICLSLVFFVLCLGRVSSCSL